MGGPPFTNPTFPVSGRRINSDGTIDIKCRICEKVICRQYYRNFSTAICAVCQGEIDQGKRPEDIVAQTLQKEREDMSSVVNDIGMGGFKVMGIGKRIVERVKEVQQAARKRMRAPIFAKRDK